MVVRNLLISTIFIILSILFLSRGSCNQTHSLDNNQSDTIQGVVYDDVVVGLGYQTKDFNSTTDENGTFNYKSGDVKFYLNRLFIGKIDSMPEDRKVFLSDLLNLKRGDYNSTKLVKLAVLLQSLDKTPLNDNKIVLNPNQLTNLFNTPNQTLDIELVDELQAQDRVKQTLINEE